MPYLEDILEEAGVNNCPKLMTTRKNSRAFGSEGKGLVGIFRSLGLHKEPHNCPTQTAIDSSH